MMRPKTGKYASSKWVYTFTNSSNVYACESHTTSKLMKVTFASFYLSDPICITFILCRFTVLVILEDV